VLLHQLFKTSSRCDELIKLAIGVKAAMALEITAIRSEGWFSVGIFKSHKKYRRESEAHEYYSHAKAMWVA
jgi:hypothetical protein